MLKYSSLLKSPKAGFFIGEHFSVFRGLIPDTDTKEAWFPKGSFRSDFFSIGCVTSGSMKIRIDFKDYEISPGCMFMSVPFSLKQIAQVDSNCHMSGVSFTYDMFGDLNLSDKISEVVGFFASKIVRPWMLDQKEWELYNYLIGAIIKRGDTLTSHIYGRELLANSIADFIFEIAEIARRKMDVVSINYGRKEELVMRFSRMAMEHHLQHRKLTFYSDKLFVTAKHLSETAKQVTGKTAGQIIDELNLIEARRLLQETHLSISEIAHLLNFSSPAFFSKFFTRMLGVSPRDYRNPMF